MPLLSNLSPSPLCPALLPFGSSPHAFAVTGHGSGDALFLDYDRSSAIVRDASGAEVVPGATIATKREVLNFTLQPIGGPEAKEDVGPRAVTIFNANLCLECRGFFRRVR